ncbi:MAG: VWA domain-containing protein [Candidatus Heimdallarchaeota archaeon]|nr:VWA domain-containing protein [Candidatus Heimdallarchaeota archaeon]
MSNEEFNEQLNDDLEMMMENNAAFDLEINELQEVNHLNLVVFVLDGSTSMRNLGKSTTRTKSIEVRDAANAFLGRLAGSSARKSFYIAAVAFSESPQLILGDEYVSLETLLGNSELWGNLTHEYPDEKLFDLVDVIESPIELTGGGRTNITAALDRAQSIAELFMKDEASDNAFQTISDRSVVIFLLSDGKHNLGEDPLNLANDINTRYPICTISYGGNQNNEDMLKAIAQSSRNYLETDSPELLREFFTSSTTLLINK